MFKTFTKLNKSRFTNRIQDENRFNNYSGKKQSLNLMKYYKSTRNFRKTTNNFKSNLSLTPFYDDARPVNIKPGNLVFFNFNKAPSMNDNYRKINNLIKLKRNQRLKELENVHNKILISESESYRNKLYITSSDFKSDKNINLIKSSSCRTIPIKINKSHKKNNRINTFQKSNI